MPLRSHHSNYNNIDEAIVAFGAWCRDHKLGVGISHTKEALHASEKGFMNDYDSMYYAFRALYCTSEEDYEIFDKCFQVFWSKRKHNYAHTIKNKNRSNITRSTNASLVMMGFNPNKKKEEKEGDEARNVTGASKIEVLKNTDFSKVAAIDNQWLEQLAEQLLMQLNHRLKRKLKTSKQGKIDLRKTIRKNISSGNLLLELARKNRKTEKYRIILLLDVSGSMDKYSFFLLKFVWSLKSILKNIEAFVFSTNLIRITEYMHHKQLEDTMVQMSRYANNWSSGTKIGACLRDFNENYAKRVLNGKSVTIILSDGLDHGNPGLLADELQKIKMRTSKLVWLNPLKGMHGYQPIARGMAAALPAIDTFESAHNLQSLLELENILANV